MNPPPTNIDAISQRLSDGKFRVRNNVALPDGPVVELSASKLHFTWKGPMLISQHLFIRYMEKPEVQDMQTLFQSGFKYAKSINRVPLLRGMHFGYMIVHCIMTAQVEQDAFDAIPEPIPPVSSPPKSFETSLLRYVTNTPKSHFSLIEFPVLYDLSSGKAHYFQSNMFWGAWIYPLAQNIVTKYIEQ